MQPSFPSQGSTVSPLPVSAFIICQDEAEYLGDCLESLRGLAEIVILDSGSTDGTEAVVRRYQAAGWPIRFRHQPWLGYAGQKQAAMALCTQPWCLNIDADERLDDDLKGVLPRLLAAPDTVVGWRLRRRPYLIGFGYTPPHVFERPNLRLIRRGAGRYDLRQRVHEGIVPDGRVEEASVGSLLHYRPLPMEQQILKENAYSTLKADQWVSAGGRARVVRLLFNPASYFFRLYIRRRLFLCGWPGFIQAMTGAVYSFLTEAKIYQRATMLEKARDKEGADRLAEPVPGE